MLNNSAGRAAGRFVGGQQKLAYALEQLFPAYGRGRRWVPSEKKFKDRQGTSYLSAWGIPLRTNTESEQANELLRRQFEKARSNG